MYLYRDGFNVNMPQIKYKDELEEIIDKPVFGVEDLVKRDISRGYAKKKLHNLAERGKIKRIERGKYTALDDPIAVAPYLTQPSYLSLWTALNIRNLTDQIPFKVQVITSRRRYKREIKFQGTPIQFHQIKKDMMYGYEYIIWQGERRIPVAKPEKIIIDSLYLNRIPREELSQAVKASDPELLTQYAELSGQKKIRRETKNLLEEQVV